MFLDLGPSRFSPAHYQEFAFPYAKRVINTIKTPEVPIFSHTDGTSFLSAPLSDLKVDIFGFDWTIDLSEGIKRIGGKKTVLGNMDPYILFGPDREIEKKVREIVEAGKEAPAHIFSLGGWIIPDTPVEKVKFLVDLVHSL